MAFPVSPGVYVREFDVNTIVPSLDASIGGIAGVFNWGPVGIPVLVDSEADLVSKFWKPSDENFQTWLTASSFLGYSNALYVVRAANTTTNSGAFNAVANTGVVVNTQLCVVKSEDDYNSKDGAFPAGTIYVAKWPGALGNSLRVSQVDETDSFASFFALNSLGTSAIVTMNLGTNYCDITINADSNVAADAAANSMNYAIQKTDYVFIGTGRRFDAFQVAGKFYDQSNSSYLTGNSTTGQARLRLTFSSKQTRQSVTMSSANNDKLVRKWAYWNLVKKAPFQSAWQRANGNTSARDEVHIVVTDRLGKITGTPGEVLEVFEGMSRATDAVNDDGTSNYYKDVINRQSKWIWWTKDRPFAVSAPGDTLASSNQTAPLVVDFYNGSDGLGESNVSVGDLQDAWDVFGDDAGIDDVGLLALGVPRGGDVGEQVANYVIQNICEERKDCVAFVSPPANTVIYNSGAEADDIETFRNNLTSSSYGFMDSGWKYMYDRYNNKYRWVPLNGDIAGLSARTDATNDAWWSPAGFNRGQIKNVVRLAWNPRKTYRDQLYKIGVNPVVQFDGSGTILYGDKTLLDEPSSFDRINVRRLFIVLEKAISRAAKFSLFEFNDEFTRAQFRNMVIPYLRDIKARRGIQDFLVVCDTTNNPGVVVDRNEFVGHIFIKPNKSINFITLSFVAVGTDVSFGSVVGKVG